jgi:hypothetical protein
MKLSIFEPLMHVLVTDVPSVLGYKTPVHYLERRWVTRSKDYQEIGRYVSDENPAFDCTLDTLA